MVTGVLRIKIKILTFSQIYGKIILLEEGIEIVTLIIEGGEKEMQDVI